MTSPIDTKTKARRRGARRAVLPFLRAKLYSPLRLSDCAALRTTGAQPAQPAQPGPARGGWSQVIRGIVTRMPPPQCTPSHQGALRGRTRRPEAEPFPRLPPPPFFRREAFGCRGCGATAASVTPIGPRGASGGPAASRDRISRVARDRAGKAPARKPCSTSRSNDKLSGSRSSGSGSGPVCGSARAVLCVRAAGEQAAQAALSGRGRGGRLIRVQEAGRGGVGWGRHAPGIISCTR